MKKLILIALFLAPALFLLSSCQSVLSIRYTEPSNVDMSLYRSVALLSAESYQDQSMPLSDYVRYLNYQEEGERYLYPSSYTFDSVSSSSADMLTDMILRVFSSSSCYSVLPPGTTDAYMFLHRLGKDSLSLIRKEGIDAVIIPRFISLRPDEYIETVTLRDYSGEEKVQYMLCRSVDISFSLIVLDVSTERIVTVRDYRTQCESREIFDPGNPVFTSIMTMEELIEKALSDKTGELTADFLPTVHYFNVAVKANDPEDESVEEAYAAVEKGNSDYALTLFRRAYEERGHVPSGYNAALILASSGDIDGALSILSDIRQKGKDDREVNYLYSELLSLKEKNEEAERRYEPEKTETDPVVISE